MFSPPPQQNKPPPRKPLSYPNCWLGKSGGLPITIVDLAAELGFKLDHCQAFVDGSQGRPHILAALRLDLQALSVRPGCVLSQPARPSRKLGPAAPQSRRFG